MSGSADPAAGAPATCRNDSPGCAGPNGFDRDYHGRTLYVCRDCMAAATAGEHGSAGR